MDKKNILLGVTGGIAAYKMVNVASGLTKKGHDVHVIMTDSAQEFISPICFKTITGFVVESDLFEQTKDQEVKHITLADNADLMLIGPATANIIGKVANGIADDLLSTIVTAVRSPVIIAPSMNVNMFNNPILQDNINYLKQKGYDMINPAEGRLACGYVGKGRLPEPEMLIEYVLKKLTDKDLANKKILVTAGPTRERIDPVRYITNKSSGKMGYALAKRAAYRGAKVKLISGPTTLSRPLGVDFERVETALDLYNSVMDCFEDFDIIVMAAAVADFTPKDYAADKLKKGNQDNFILDLKRTNDVINKVVKNKDKEQVVVGFAAESKDLIENAEKKLINKGLDMIVANDIKNKKIFNQDESEVVVITEEKKIDISRSAKENIADRIYDMLK
ncbi:MAG: bifunctional phosphopantothenoylcysteine decarboxylase/phosphopantothenate--cysteine ligase CoaBC [Halanaerobiales bacterium]|nr:bifunctional phosphopantothenoylcysteine decarboxylase/phosphopantothenate--cysteine ligase CoaBC [Halanaerobiales bacterium]